MLVDLYQKFHFRFNLLNLMKLNFTILNLAIAGLALAQSYSVTAPIIASGGGASSGGAYAVTGVIAQQEANATSSGGSYSLSGGFFAQYLALQQAGAPPISIRSAGSTAQVVWGSNVPGWILQANSNDLDPASWIDVVGTPTVNGADQFLPFAATGGRVFFRLRKL
jgi:hypothetical protein